MRDRDRDRDMYHLTPSAMCNAMCCHVMSCCVVLCCVVLLYVLRPAVYALLLYRCNKKSVKQNSGAAIPQSSPQLRLGQQKGNQLFALAVSMVRATTTMPCTGSDDLWCSTTSVCLFNVLVCLRPLVEVKVYMTFTNCVCHVYHIY